MLGVREKYVTTEYVVANNYIKSPTVDAVDDAKDIPSGVSLISYRKWWALFITIVIIMSVAGLLVGILGF